VLSVFRNPGLRGGLEAEPAWSVDLLARLDSMDFGDMNGDGRIDLAALYHGEVRWFENTTTSASAFGFVAHGPTIHLGLVGVDLGPELADR
jgi:hypothetical protein